jgi:hypothetical protein
MARVSLSPRKLERMNPTVDYKKNAADIQPAKISQKKNLFANKGLKKH